MKNKIQSSLKTSMLAIELGLSKDDNDPTKNQILKLSLLKQLKKMRNNQLKLCENYSQIISIIELTEIS
jgi:hypothetical protein